MHPEFPDEDIMASFEEKLDKDRDKWIMWFDGASNVLGHGVGAALVSPNNQCIPFTTRLGFDCTNNMAEYEACALRQRQEDVKEIGGRLLLERKHTIQKKP